MSESDRCKRCGSPLPPDVLEGHCPKCLLEAGLKATATGPLSRQHPERVGPYYVLNLLGEGGMGIVYLAEQREPMRRRVALKLMKPDFNSRQVIARFESERQALALMNHPGVARVFDAGLAEDGRLYFVMEYVAGLPITEFCDRRQLSVPDRLKLFVLVCDAIQHAHQKGLIHRDIKPSNVLVTEQEGAPSVKVIDFGVAKATNLPLSPGTLFTEHGVMVGTPAYMSPEQAETDALDVDTRSDIYSLGVLLYELLVGALPFDAKSLKQAALAEMLRQIREEEPQKPTTRLERLGATAETVARQRQTDVRSLSRLLKGDLDWITMRALEKTPTRRYGSASDFAADIQRYFAQEPVVAGPPSARYRLQKLVRRHRVGTAAVLGVFFTLVLGVAVSTNFYLRAERDRERVQLEADSFAAALRNEPERYVGFATQALERHRAVLGSGLEFARHLAFHLAISYDPALNVKDVRQDWEKEALQIVDRELDAGNSDAVDVALALVDGLSDQTRTQELSSKALALLQQRAKTLNNADAGRLADLFEHGRPAQPMDPGSERIAREVLKLRRQTLPGGLPKLKNSVESLADLLFRKASILAHQGAWVAACPPYSEARSLISELGLGTGAYSAARLSELDVQFGACASSFSDVLLKQAYLDLEKSGGSINSATQTVLNRLIDFYQQQGGANEAARHRALRPSISLSDVWDLGPIQLGQRQPQFANAISFSFRQGSAWVMWNDGASTWGVLQQDAFKNGQPLIRETAASAAHANLLPLTRQESDSNAEHNNADCRVDCGSQWVLTPRSAVGDPVRDRTLIFYSKVFRSLSEGAKLAARKAGVSLAVWKAVEGSAERPEVQQGSAEPTILFGPDEPEWGTAALVHENLLYAYACEPSKTGDLEMRCLLARAPLDGALDRGAWRFYAGGSWSENWREAKTVMDPFKSSLLSVHWNNYLGKFLAISTRILDHKIQLRVADRPEGSWSQPVVEVEGLRPSIGHIFPWIGASVGHPELAVDDGRVEYITYSRPAAAGNETRMVRIEFAKK